MPSLQQLHRNRPHHRQTDDKNDDHDLARHLACTQASQRSVRASEDFRTISVLKAIIKQRIWDESYDDVA